MPLDLGALGNGVNASIPLDVKGVQPPPNLLDMYGKMAQIRNEQNTNTAFQNTLNASQELGQVVKDSTVDGKVDQGLFAQNVAEHPNISAYAPEKANAIYSGALTSSQISGQQMEQQSKVVHAVMDETGRAGNMPRSVYAANIDAAIATAPTYMRDTLTKYAKTLGETVNAGAPDGNTPEEMAKRKEIIFPRVAVMMPRDAQSAGLPQPVNIAAGNRVVTGAIDPVTGLPEKFGPTIPINPSPISTVVPMGPNAIPGAFFSTYGGGNAGTNGLTSQSNSSTDTGKKPGNGLGAIAPSPGATTTTPGATTTTSTAVGGNTPTPLGMEEWIKNSGAKDVEVAHTAAMDIKQAETQQEYVEQIERTLDVNDKEHYSPSGPMREMRTHLARWMRDVGHALTDKEGKNLFSPELIHDIGDGDISDAQIQSTMMRQNFVGQLTRDTSGQGRTLQTEANAYMEMGRSDQSPGALLNIVHNWKKQAQTDYNWNRAWLQNAAEKYGSNVDVKTALSMPVVDYEPSIKKNLERQAAYTETTRPQPPKGMVGQLQNAVGNALGGMTSPSASPPKESIADVLARREKGGK